MTAPLYEVKKQFSKYVKLAELGQKIEVTKHGKPTVVVLSSELYEKEIGAASRSFMEAHIAWQKRWQVKNAQPDNTTPWDNIRSKEIYEGKNIWAD